MAILLLSAGTPLISGGAEFNRTQFGNNNAFNLDTVANWFDWNAAGKETALTEFTRIMIGFRRAHQCLRPVGFFTGTDHNGNELKDLTWYFDSGAEVMQDYFTDANNHFLTYRIDGSEFGDAAASVYVAYNGSSSAIRSTIPLPLAGRQWFVVADTSTMAEVWRNIHAPGQEIMLMHNVYTVNARSVVLLIEH